MKKKSREISVFSLSFLDVFANTIGGLAFLLILAVLMMGAIVFAPPRILTEELPAGHHGRPYRTWLACRDGLGKFVWSLGEGELPAGLELDPETGELAGRPELAPEDGEAHRYAFEVHCESYQKATEEPDRDTRRFELTVFRRQPIESTPLRLITEPKLPMAFRGRPYPLAFAAEGGQAPYRWSGKLPAGLTLTPEGRVSGAPTATGESRFEVAVETPRGERQMETFSLTVSEKHPAPPPIPPLVVRTDHLPEAVAERSYGLQMAAEGGQPPYRWSVASGAPTWLGAQAGGALIGTPGLDHLGRTTIVARVTDRSGQTAASEPLELRVLPPIPEEPPPLVLKTRSLPEARAGQPYHLALAAEGGFPPYQWSAEGLGKASGLSFTATTGTLEGTPRVVGRLPLTVRLADRAGREVRRQLPLRVRPSIRAVTIRTQDLPAARVGKAYSLALSAVGGHPPYRWQRLEGELPPGLELEEETGLLAGEPRQAGDWDLLLSTADAEGQAARSPLAARLTVLTAQGFHPLTITTRALPVLLAGDETDLTLAAEGGEPPYQWQVSNPLPPGLRLEEGRLLGVPARAGDFELPVQVADASGLTARASFPLLVRRVAPFWLTVLLALLAGLLTLIALWLLIKVRRAQVQPLRITTESLPNARASFPYAVQLACEGGVPPYFWQVVAVDGELPPGLELDPSGRLYGKPFEGIGLDTTREIRFQVEVRDGWGRTARQEL